MHRQGALKGKTMQRSIGEWRNALKTVWDGLEQRERDEFEERAKQWTTDGPDEEYKFG
jgi:hypothetical protein